MLGVIESRSWAPRYRGTIMSDAGKSLASRHFFFKKNILPWFNSWVLENYKTEVETHGLEK